MPEVFNFAGLILMGPFGSGKSFLGRSLDSEGIAQFTDLEPIIYDLFSNESGLDIEKATRYIRSHYFDSLSSAQPVAAFESTGVVQRPLLLEVMEKFKVAVIQVQTPKKICLERVAQRNQRSKHPIELSKADEFYDYWTEEIAPTYKFDLEVDGLDAESAIGDIRKLICMTNSDSEIRFRSLAASGDPERGLEILDKINANFGT